MYFFLPKKRFGTGPLEYRSKNLFLSFLKMSQTGGGGGGVHEFFFSIDFLIEGSNIFQTPLKKNYSILKILNLLF